jgi:hypothetical protein
MAKLLEGNRVYVYNGKRYGVPKDMDDDQARDAVRSMLNQPAETSSRSGRNKSARTRITPERSVDPETESEGFYQEIAEGIGSGLIKAGQGIGELAVLPSDLIFDTDYANRIQDNSEKLQDFLGLDPVGLPAELAEVAVQFVVPGGLAAKAVTSGSKLLSASRLTKIPGLGFAERGTRAGRYAEAVRKGRASIGGPKTTKLSRGNRATVLAQQSAAAFGADAIVASDGTTTIGDWVEGGPTLTDKNVGLSGREEAIRLLENKLKLGAEAGTLTAAAPYLFKALGIMGKPVAGVAGAGLEATVLPTAKALKLAAETLGDSALAKSIGDLPVPSIANKVGPNSTVKDVVQGIQARFRFRGNMSQEAAEVRSGMQGYLDSVATKAGITMQRLETEIDKAFKTGTVMTRFLNGSSDLERTEVFNSIYGFLSKDPGYIDSLARAAQREGRAFDATNPDDLLRGLPAPIQRVAKRMRKEIDDLSKQVIKSKYFNQEIGEDMQEEIVSNLGSYLRRKYRVFQDPDAYFGNPKKGISPSTEYINNRKAAANLLSDPANYNTTKDLYQKVVRPLGDGEELGITTNGGAAPQFVDEIVTKLVNKYRDKTGVQSPDKKTSGRVIRDKLKTSLLSPRRVDNDALRLLLGEIKNPAESFVTTMADLGEFVAKERFYSFLDSTKVTDTALVQGGKLANDADIVGGDVYARLSAEEKAKYVELDEDGTGVLQSRTAEGGVTEAGTKIPDDVSRQTYVKSGMYKDLTRSTWQETAPVIRQVYSTYMLGKGWAQKAATVFSPVTQIRNVSSAALFAAANGNWGRGANVFESTSLVLENLRKAGPVQRQRYYQMLQENGIIGTQAQIREIDRIIDDGLQTTTKSEFDALGVNLAQKKARGKGGQFLSSLDKGARDLYQGGDDIWKIYSFDFERSKILNAFDGDTEMAEAFARSQEVNGIKFKDLNEYAASIVKDTVPNYDRVPQFVKDIRALPLGNFVAFPAEIVRTSTNIIERSIKEIQEGRRLIDSGEVVLGSKLRDIGRRRLLGFTTTASVTGPALQNFAMYMTGVSGDAIDALREVVPTWSQNSTLVPTSVDNDGNISGYTDFSFFNPYDYLQRPIKGILNEVNKGNELGLDATSIAANAGMTMLSEMFSPFAEESIFTEKLLDVFARGGTTKTGARIWNETDATGTKIGKSLGHIADAANPGIVREAVGDLSAVNPRTQNLEFSSLLGGDLPMNSRLATALGVGTDPRGNTRQLGEEVFRLFTGFAEQRVNPKQSLMYRSLEYLRNERQPQSQFNRAMRVGSVAPLVASDLLEAYQDQNETAFREQSKMYRLITKMEALGMKRSAIETELKTQRIPDYKNLMRGVFTPLNISQDLVKDVNSQQLRFYGGDRVPFLELRGLKRELSNKQLSSKLAEGDKPLGADRQSLNLDASAFISQAEARELPQPVAAGTVPPSVPAQAGAVPAPLTAPASPPQVSRDPALMGGDPFSALKNMQTFGNN